MPHLSTASQLPKKIPSLNSPPKSRVAPISKPVGIDPVEIMKGREYKIQSSIVNRIHAIQNLPNFISEDMRMQALIELKSLRLLQFQKQLRKDLVMSIRKDSTLETSLNSRAYKRS